MLGGGVGAVKEAAIGYGLQVRSRAARVFMRRALRILPEACSLSAACVQSRTLNFPLGISLPYAIARVSLPAPSSHASQ